MKTMKSGGEIWKSITKGSVRLMYCFWPMVSKSMKITLFLLLFMRFIIIMKFSSKFVIMAFSMAFLLAFKNECHPERDQMTWLFKQLGLSTNNSYFFIKISNDMQNYSIRQLYYYFWKSLNFEIIRGKWSDPCELQVQERPLQSNGPQF